MRLQGAPFFSLCPLCLCGEPYLLNTCRSTSQLSIHRSITGRLDFIYRPLRSRHRDRRGFFKRLQGAPLFSLCALCLCGEIKTQYHTSQIRDIIFNSVHNCKTQYRSETGVYFTFSINRWAQALK